MRTFIAIELPEETKAYLATIQTKLRASGANVKWVNPKNIHLTLKFIGEIDENTLQKAGLALEEAARNKESFLISLSSLGAFPKINSPRVIWIGVDKGESQVREIARLLEEKLREIGIPEEEREFSSHITLGRVRSGLNRNNLVKVLEGLKDLNAGGGNEFQANKITLFKSTLKPAGPVYEAMKTADLHRN